MTNYICRMVSFFNPRLSLLPVMALLSACQVPDSTPNSVPESEVSLCHCETKASVQWYGSTLMTAGPADGPTRVFIFDPDSSVPMRSRKVNFWYGTSEDSLWVGRSFAGYLDAGHHISLKIVEFDSAFVTASFKVRDLARDSSVSGEAVLERLPDYPQRGEGVYSEQPPVVIP